MNQDQRDELVRHGAPRIAEQIAKAAREARNEAEFRKPVGRILDDFAQEVRVHHGQSDRACLQSLIGELSPGAAGGLARTQGLGYTPANRTCTSHRGHRV